VPTNGVSAIAVDPTLFAEAALGFVLLAIPIIYMPELLYLPCWFVFAWEVPVRPRPFFAIP
jgi:hypothetical protein